MYYKLKFGESLKTKGFWYGFEKDFTMRIEKGGIIDLGHRAYFSKRTDLHAIGGRIIIGNDVFFNKDCTIVSRSFIKIGNDCLFGEAVSIYDHNHNLVKFDEPISKQGFTSKPITIGNNVWIGSKAFIKSGVAIGDNVIVGASSIVTKAIPNEIIAYGNPPKFRIIKEVH